MPVRPIAEVFPPGDFIRDELEARGWSQTHLAELIGRPIQTVNMIIKGKKQITAETALQLAGAFGTSPELWMNLETGYQLARARSAARARPKADVGRARVTAPTARASPRPGKKNS